MHFEHYIFLVDYSYSMCGHIPKIVTVINMFLAEVKKSGKTNVLFSLASFSYRLVWIVKAANLNNIENIKNDDFKDAGSTSLYDSVCSVLLEFGCDSEFKNIFYIITDGDDNNSFKFTRETTDELCDKAMKTNWTIKHFDTLNYQTLSVPTIKFDIDDMSNLFNNMKC